MHAKPHRTAQERVAGLEAGEGSGSVLRSLLWLLVSVAGFGFGVGYLAAKALEVLA